MSRKRASCKEFIPANTAGGLGTAAWLPHFRYTRLQLHHHIELVEDGARVVVALVSHPLGGDLEVEYIGGHRRGSRIIFEREPTLYPGLRCTPYDAFAVQHVDLSESEVPVE